MKITQVPISELKPAPYNPRKKSEHVLNTIRASLRERGWLVPLVVNSAPERKNIIIGGHRRLEAATLEGKTEVPVIYVNEPDLIKEKRLNLQLNAEEEYELKGLAEIVADIHRIDPTLAATIGFSSDNVTKLLYQDKYAQHGASGILAEKFLILPFTIIDSRQEYWRKRKKKWLNLLTFEALAETRKATLSKGEKNLLIKGVNAGVSVFDPVLSEVVYTWFLPKGGKRILDPFAGSLSRGGVAAVLGYDYTGIELRAEQIEANNKKLDEINYKARYIQADARKLSEVLQPEDRYDLLFTCPPYYDLEVYSQDQSDLSNQPSYEEFMQGMKDVYRQAVAHLHDNRFVVLVLGEIRDKQGYYYNFIGDHIKIFKELGYRYYNEAIYVQMLATAPYRAERNMTTRKIVKTHQNLITFYKGDPKLHENPQLLEIHKKVLTFFKDQPETIKEQFENPPPIRRELSDIIDIEQQEYETESLPKN